MSYPNNGVFQSSVTVQPRVEKRIAKIDPETGALTLDGGIVGNPFHMHERPPDELPAIAEEPTEVSNKMLLLALAAIWAYRWLR